MGIVRSAGVKRGLETLWNVGVIAESEDSALLARFLSRSEGNSAAAFRVLVERHGAMVERTCPAWKASSRRHVPAGLVPSIATRPLANQQVRRPRCSRTGKAN